MGAPHGPRERIRAQRHGDEMDVVRREAAAQQANAAGPPAVTSMVRAEIR
jgi:hypothetical protein